VNLHIDVELRTDTCLGGGHTAGAGDVDTAAETDADGMPVLRGRTLKGLLVEEAATVLMMTGKAAELCDAAKALFGDPGQHGTTGILSFADGSVPPAVRSAFLSNKWRATSLTTVRRQTAIDPERGAAQAGSLRSTRLVRAGLVLRATVVAIRAPSPTERALLAACVASVRRVGLHRNEGWGRVACRLLDAEGVDRTGEWLAGLDTLGTHADPVAVAESSERSVVAATTNTGRTVVEFDLDLERPAVFPDRAAGDWVTTTLGYVPGSALLGACAARWLASNRCEDPSSDDRFRRLFLDGSVRWLNAYPRDSDRRAVPTPRSWRIDDPDPRTSSASVLDLAHPDAHDHLEDAEPGDWVPVSGTTFAHSGGERLTLLRPQTTAQMHHQRDRDAGRSQAGELFVYDALAPGQQLRGAVLCERSSDADAILGLLTGALLDLGRSRSASYGGGARILAVKARPSAEWKGELGEPGRVLLLTSDYLGRSENGTADPSVLVDELCEHLGVAPQLLAITHRTVHGSVGRWEMPRPAHRAVAAGSVLVVPLDAKIDPARWSELAWLGLGERRAEGFGRLVALNTPDDAVQRVAWSSAKVGVADVKSFPGDDGVLARIKRWVGFERLRGVMIADATAVGAGLRFAPPSLVGRLRQQVRAARSLAEVTAFLRDLGSKKAGKGLARVASGRSFADSVAADCEKWQEKFRHELPKGVSMDDVAPLGWTLQQAWLDAVLERWRRKVQKEAE